MRDCYNCNAEVEKLYPTYWTDQQVCEDCVLHSDEYPRYVFEGLPTPPEVLAAIEQSPTVEAVREAFRLCDPTCECGHPKSDHREGSAYGLETFHCTLEGCRCAEFSSLPRIQIKPVQFAETLQGKLFNEKEVA